MGYQFNIYSDSMKAINGSSSPSGQGLPQRIPTRGPNGFVRGLRTLLYYFVAFFVFIWGMNTLGVSTILNDPEIYYSGVHANTGKHAVVQGCRPERVRPDGSCNKSIDLPTIIEAFPKWSR